MSLRLQNSCKIPFSYTWLRPIFFRAPLGFFLLPIVMALFQITLLRKCFRKNGHSRRLFRVFFRAQNRVCGVLVLKGSKILQYLAFFLFQAFVYEICKKKWRGGRRCFIGLLAGNRKIETFICFLS